MPTCTSPNTWALAACEINILARKQLMTVTLRLIEPFGYERMKDAKRRFSSKCINGYINKRTSLQRASLLKHSHPIFPKPNMPRNWMRRGQHSSQVGHIKYRAPKCPPTTTTTPPAPLVALVALSLTTLFILMGPRVFIRWWVIIVSQYNGLRIRHWIKSAWIWQFAHELSRPGAWECAVEVIKSGPRIDWLIKISQVSN